MCAAARTTADQSHTDSTNISHARSAGMSGHEVVDLLGTDHRKPSAGE